MKIKITAKRAQEFTIDMINLSEIANECANDLWKRLDGYDNNSKLLCLGMFQTGLTRLISNIPPTGELLQRK